MRAYEALVHLYPVRFRRDFGAAMIDAFGEMVDRHGPLGAWRVVGGELLQTLAREHAAEMVRGTVDLVSRAGSLSTPLRVALACAMPALVYARLLEHAVRAEDIAAATLWLGGMGAGIVRARGRGWTSVRGAVLGALIGSASMIAYDAASGSPQVLSVAPLLLALSAAVAFTVASYVRLVMEGVDLGRRWPRRTSPMLLSGGW